MFLEMTRERNPELLATAAELHREGVIAPDTFVLDIDRIAENARVISAKANRLGIALYAMTKQSGRNPFMARAALLGGIPSAVAVEFAEARILHLHGIPLGNIGHLVQVPMRDVPAAVSMKPEVMTIFTVDSARRVASVAASRGIQQGILLRVLDDSDFSYPGQQGGFRLSELSHAVSAIRGLTGVRLTGVTSFPCLLYDYESHEVRATSNFSTLLAAANILRHDFGVTVEQINAPSVTCAATIPLLASMGATHGEPGSALTGNTPLHAVTRQPEVPAQVYVSEVASIRDNTAFCFGGGFYARSRVSRALLMHQNGNDPVEVEVDPLPADAIDYYGTLQVPRGVRVEVGDTLLFAFRPQAFVTRSRVAAIAGLGSGPPELLGVCDARGNLLGPDDLPLGSVLAQENVERVWSKYSAGSRLISS